jgi:hypothetical protein
MLIAFKQTEFRERKFSTAGFVKRFVKRVWKCARWRLTFSIAAYHIDFRKYCAAVEMPKVVRLLTKTRPLVQPPIALQDQAITSAAYISISAVMFKNPTWQGGERGDMCPLCVPHHLGSGAYECILCALQAVQVFGGIIHHLGSHHVGQK